MTNDGVAAVMEKTLLAIADANVDIVPMLFTRFLAAYPEQRTAFTNLEAAQGRMTNETVEALLGLATREYWVPVEQYAAFVNMLVDTLAEAAGRAWTEAQDHAWKSQAKRLNGMIAEACAGKTPAMYN